MNKIIQNKIHLLQNINIKSLSTLTFTKNYYEYHEENERKDKTYEISNSNFKFEHVKDELKQNDVHYEFETVFSEHGPDVFDNEDNIKILKENNANVKGVKRKDISESEEERVDHKIEYNYIILPITLEELEHMRSKEKKWLKFQKALYKCESCIKVFYNEEQMNKHNDQIHDEVINNNSNII